MCCQQGRLLADPEGRAPLHPVQASTAPFLILAWGRHPGCQESRGCQPGQLQEGILALEEIQFTA